MGYQLKVWDRVEQSNPADEKLSGKWVKDPDALLEERDKPGKRKGSRQTVAAIIVYDTGLVVDLKIRGGFQNRDVRGSRLGNNVLD